MEIAYAKIDRTSGSLKCRDRNALERARLRDVGELTFIGDRTVISEAGKLPMVFRLSYSAR